MTAGKSLHLSVDARVSFNAHARQLNNPSSPSSVGVVPRAAETMPLKWLQDTMEDKHDTALITYAACEQE